MENQPHQIQPSNNSDGKTIAIVAYLTLIGLIIAFVMNNDKKNPLASFHTRQSLGIMLTGMACGVLSFIPFIGWIAGGIGSLLVFVLWIIGLIGAVNEKQEPVPVVGPLYQKWFAGM